MINYKEYIAEIITKAFPNLTNVEVVNPPNDKMGDYAVATFSLDISDLKNPAEKAKFLKNNLQFDSKIISSIIAMGPYVNFFINRNHLAGEVINCILNEKEKYGSSNIGTGEKLLIEHTSINPNASPHIGRARNSIIGDFLVRLYRFSGYDVETHYFINDIGKQIAMLLVGVELKKMEQMTFGDMLNLYIEINEISKTDTEIETKIFHYLNALENGDDTIREKFKKLTKVCVTGQQEIFAKMGIIFDVFTHESDFVYDDVLGEILNKLKQKKRLKEDENGRFYVDLDGYNIPTINPVLVLTRQDKTSLYPLRDIAYTIEKIKLNSKNNFIVLGEDQEVYMQQISAVMDILGYNYPKLVTYSFVLLNGDKMATREGKVVLLEDFIEETKSKLRDSYEERGSNVDENVLSNLAASCIKYNMLNVNRRRSVNFSLEEATNFQGDSAIYLLYNYVRIISILEKSPSNVMIDKYLFESEYEQSLLFELYKFPEIIDLALTNQESIYITRYLHTISQKFSQYYKAVPILAEDDESIKSSRLILLRCLKIVYENAMNILGITPISKM